MQMVWKVTYGPEPFALFFTDEREATDCVLALSGFYGSRIERTALVGDRTHLDAVSAQGVVDYYYGQMENSRRNKGV